MYIMQNNTKIVIDKNITHNKSIEYYKSRRDNKYAKIENTITQLKQIEKSKL